MSLALHVFAQVVNNYIATKRRRSICQAMQPFELADAELEELTDHVRLPQAGLGRKVFDLVPLLRGQEDAGDNLPLALGKRTPARLRCVGLCCHDNGINLLRFSRQHRSHHLTHVTNHPTI